jgi:hypothetical protein
MAERNDCGKVEKRRRTTLETAIAKGALVP